MNSRESYHLSLSFLIYKLSEITPVPWRLLGRLKKKNARIESLQLTHKQRSRTGTYCHRNCHNVIINFKSRASRLYSRNFNQFPHPHLVLIACSFSFLNEPGQVAMLLWPWLFSQIACVKLKNKAGERSHIELYLSLFFWAQGMLSSALSDKAWQ